MIVTTMLPECQHMNDRMTMLVKTCCELKVPNQSFFLIQSQVPELKVKLFFRSAKQHMNASNCGFLVRNDEIRVPDAILPTSGKMFTEASQKASQKHSWPKDAQLAGSRVPFFCFLLKVASIIIHASSHNFESWKCQRTCNCVEWCVGKN